MRKTAGRCNSNLLIALTCAYFFSATLLMRVLHSSIDEKAIVQLQKLELVLTHGNNPPDGFLKYRKALHSPPEGAFHLLGGGIISSRCRRHFFVLKYVSPDLASIFTYLKHRLSDFSLMQKLHSRIAAFSLERKRAIPKYQSQQDTRVGKKTHGILHRHQRSRTLQR